MIISGTKAEIIYIHPGEVYFGNKDTIVSTVLGSCLTVTMNSTQIKLAGISHCMLPACPDSSNNCKYCKSVYKYVDCTVMKMLEFFKSKGIAKQHIEVKIFGGADVLMPVNNSGNTATIGFLNTRSALNIIKKLDLTLVSSDTGGTRGRRLFFHTNTGKIFIKKIEGECGRLKY